ncbi:polysaccharide deacetylase family protein [Salinimicrobium sp. HB62]|uniref:polysaccharide deacetylase family protein n=1 Tax=Salinimicrobium sp. HB62 TaxID=3077781 RepID=UPI002D79B51F|nr:polysaccharide deacetylase family protein [Salinimicrobium sp. HB62]
MRERVPAIIKWMYPQRIWDGPAGDKDLYLTFDDGPIPGPTEWVLEQLKTYNAKATFFCIGENVEKNPEIFRQVLAEGHVVGNHTYNHLDGWRTPIAEYLENTTRAQKVMERELPDGVSLRNPFFRPPYGKIKNVQAKKLQKLGYRTVMWSIVSMDYDHRISAERCYQNVVKNARPGSVIVFHDSHKAEKNLREVLPLVLEHYTGLGYSFKSL